MANKRQKTDSLQQRLMKMKNPSSSEFRKTGKVQKRQRTDGLNQKLINESLNIVTDESASSKKKLKAWLRLEKEMTRGSKNPTELLNESQLVLLLSQVPSITVLKKEKEQALHQQLKTTIEKEYKAQQKSSRVAINTASIITFAALMIGSISWLLLSTQFFPLFSPLSIYSQFISVVLKSISSLNALLDVLYASDLFLYGLGMLWMSGSALLVALAAIKLDITSPILVKLSIIAISIATLVVVCFIPYIIGYAAIAMASAGALLAIPAFLTALVLGTGILINRLTTLIQDKKLKKLMSKALEDKAIEKSFDKKGINTEKGFENTPKSLQRTAKIVAGVPSNISVQIKVLARLENFHRQLSPLCMPSTLNKFLHQTLSESMDLIAKEMTQSNSCLRNTMIAIAEQVNNDTLPLYQGTVELMNQLFEKVEQLSGNSVEMNKAEQHQIEQIAERLTLENMGLAQAKQQSASWNQQSATALNATCTIQRWVRRKQAEESTLNLLGKSDSLLKQGIFQRREARMTECLAPQLTAEAAGCG